MHSNVRCCNSINSYNLIGRDKSAHKLYPAMLSVGYPLSEENKSLILKSCNTDSFFMSIEDLNRSAYFVTDMRKNENFASKNLNTIGQQLNIGLNLELGRPELLLKLPAKLTKQQYLIKGGNLQQ